MNIKEIIQEQRGSIIDVRTPAEFEKGHVTGALNFPLGEINARLEEIRALPTPFILCCVSGNRSGFATQVLTGEGFECANAGSWLEVKNYLLQPTAQPVRSASPY